MSNLSKQVFLSNKYNDRKVLLQSCRSSRADHELHILLSLKKIGCMCKIPFCKCGHICGSIKPKYSQILFILPEIEQDEYILIEQSLNRIRYIMAITNSIGLYS